MAQHLNPNRFTFQHLFGLTASQAGILVDEEMAENIGRRIPNDDVVQDDAGEVDQVLHDADSIYCGAP